MPSPECKVYFDGSHYIAIPHTTRRYKPRRKPKEELITVGEQKEPPKTQNETTMSKSTDKKDDLTPIEPAETPSGILNEHGEPKVMTKRELFNEIYQQCVFMKYGARKTVLMEKLRPYFKNDDALRTYVESNLARKKRNLIARRIRLTRKANLQDFNFFVTFTYDGAKHTEETFRKKLKNCLSLFCSRKCWKYIGVWERSPEKKRLHFHGIFTIPEGTMPGILYEVKDYNFKSHRHVTTVQNTYFNEHFGRCDFERIEDHHRIGDALAYPRKDFIS